MQHDNMSKRKTKNKTMIIHVLWLRIKISGISIMCPSNVSNPHSYAALLSQARYDSGSSSSSTLHIKIIIPYPRIHHALFNAISLHMIIINHSHSHVATFPRSFNKEEPMRV